MNLSSPFIHRPVMTTFIMLTLIIAGYLAFLKLPVSDLPTIEHPKINISAGYVGANAETVMNLVTIPLEKELVHVKGVKEIASTSSPGHSSIGLSFDLDQNMDQAIRDVQSALNRADHHLPTGIDPRPSFKLQEDNQDPIIYLILTGERAKISELRGYADAYILPRFNRIPGVSNVKIFGLRKELWLKLNPELMAMRQIAFDQVVDTIKEFTEQAPLGSIQTGNKSLSIELSGTVKEASRLENLKIGSTSVRIKEIGMFTDKSDEEFRFNFVTQELTTPALILAIQKVNDANTVAISDAVRESLQSLEKELPSSVHLKLWLDKAVWIKESILDVEWSLLIAFILVILVIFLSLGRILEALIVSAALPLSLIGTFTIMYLCHFTLDLLSLLALTLSVGFVVDDAIVVLENIVRHQEEGSPPLKASLEGSKQIGFTILSMTVSLVAVFIPILFMEGMNGRLFREFSITLAVAILMSGFISLTLTPMLCSRFLSLHKKNSSLQNGVKRANQWFVQKYSMTLKWCLRFRKTVLFCALLIMGIAIPLFNQLTVQLIPSEDRGFLFTSVSLPSGLSKSESKSFQEKLESLIKENPSVDNFLAVTFDQNLLFVIRLHPLDQRKPQAEVIKELQAVLDSVPGIRTHIQGYQLLNLDLNFGSSGQYRYLIRGLDFNDVEKAAQELTEAFKALPIVSFAEHSLKSDAPKLVVHFNHELAHVLGISKKQVEKLLQQAYGQGKIGSIQKAVDQEDIYMELEAEYQDHAGALSKLYLTSKNGELVPLKSLVHWEEVVASPNLKRREQLPAAVIRFSLEDSVKPNEGLLAIENMANNMLSGQVSGQFDGSAKAIVSALNSTLLLLLAAAVVMYIVLGILYESFIHPLTILSSLPFASLGGILTLYIFDEPISIFSSVGFLLLIGIVKKNGIMMIDYALEAQKRGLSSEEGIFEGCIARFRPIMMTTVTAIMGAIPIAIGFGEGAEMRKGLGLVIVGGLLFSQLLTLYVTPVLYLIFDKLRSFKFTTQEIVDTPKTSGLPIY